MQFLPPDRAITKSPTLQAHIDAKPAKPKLYFREIAKKNKILVPDAWEDPRETDRRLKKGEKILSRSDHRLEMFYSDLLASKVIDNKFIGLTSQSYADFTAFGKTYTDLDHEEKAIGKRSELEATCRIIGIDFQAFLSDVHASFWQFIEGIKVTIVADSAVPKRYHILGSGVYPAYAMVDNGKIHKNSNFNIILPHISSLISFYNHEQDVFCDGNKHCPIIEAKVTEKGIYHLQLHLGLDFSPAVFKVDWRLRKGEIRVPFVRGCTESADYATRTISLYSNKKELLPGEGATQHNMIGPLLGILSRELPLFIYMGGANRKAIPTDGEQHDVISSLFKPQLTMLMHDLKQQFCWGKDTNSRIFLSSRSKSEVKRKVMQITDGRINIDFPQENEVAEIGFYKNKDSNVHLWIINCGRQYHVVQYYSSPGSMPDDKAIVSYVSDGTEARLKRIG
jgi:hypothetical protein